MVAISHDDNMGDFFLLVRASHDPSKVSIEFHVRCVAESLNEHGQPLEKEAASLISPETSAILSTETSEECNCRTVNRTE